MTQQMLSASGIVAMNPAVRVGASLGIILLMGNLDALVDAVVHPEIPYGDAEHLIVGGVTGLVSAVVLGVSALHARHLEKALMRIRMLEEYVPICAQCKRIRKPDSDPKHMDSWQPIESYITERTATKFSHGMCPECAAKLYPQYVQK